MMETANEKLEALLGRVIRVEFTDGSVGRGRLTKIKADPVVIDDGSGSAVMLVPHGIVLDHSDSFTHTLASIRRIELAAKVPEQIKRVEQAPREHIQNSTAPIKPLRVVKFVQPETFEDHD